VELLNDCGVCCGICMILVVIDGLGRVRLRVAEAEMVCIDD